MISENPHEQSVSRLCLLHSANCQFAKFLNLEKSLMIQNVFVFLFHVKHKCKSCDDTSFWLKCISLETKELGAMQWRIQDFPWEGGPLGDVDLQRRCFSVKIYAIMKELNLVGGVGRSLSQFCQCVGVEPPPRSAAVSKVVLRLFV